MNKYLQIFKISFQQEFAYKINFIMWRVRNIFAIFLIFFLWDTVFSDPQKVLFGYDRAKILTYIFGLIFVRSVVLSIRSTDMAGEIARGDVFNMLLKPVSYIKYWLTRDIASKVLNLVFSVFEAMFLYILLKPNFYFQTDPLLVILFIISLLAAVILYFLLVFLFSMPPFWIPNHAWGFMFLLVIFADLLGGGVFPIDILPFSVQKIIYFTPFPYLLYIPIKIYLGNYSPLIAMQFILMSLLWILLVSVISKKVWSLGLVANKT